MAQEANFVDEKNLWRTETPGHAGWQRTAHPNDPNKYLMISADCHCNEPGNLWWQRIDKKFQNRLPHVEVDEKGEKWIVAEGYERSRLRARNIGDAPQGGEPSWGLFVGPPCISCWKTSAPSAWTAALSRCRPSTI